MPAKKNGVIVVAGAAALLWWLWRQKTQAQENTSFGIGAPAGGGPGASYYTENSGDTTTQNVFNTYNTVEAPGVKVVKLDRNGCC